MNTFEVWAPKANAVELVSGGIRFAMQPQQSGWWRVEAPDTVGEYAYALDGGAPLPDPRSPCQPQGVDGLSKAVDHSRFRWKHPHWQTPPLSSAVVYELHIGTFTPEGTFLSAIGKLHHLKNLGITHVEIMPVSEFSGKWGWGYDGATLYAPHHAYGSPDDLKALVDACHERGLAVLLDVVYNHLGPVGNYLDRFGPYFVQRHKTPWGPAVNLDAERSDEVRRFICDNALMWLRDYHFDGLRLDAIHALIDESATHILEQLSREVDDLEAHLGRHLVLIAESDLNDPRVVREFGMDAQWSDDFHHSLHCVLTGERNGYYCDFGNLAHLARAFKDAFVYQGDYSAYRKRSHGRATGDLPGSHFLAYLQNHDQIGNRPMGERSSMLLNKRRLKIGAALVILSPFIPMLFQGEEWAARQPFQYFTQHENEELGKMVSSGRKQEFISFGWDPDLVPDPQDPRTFQRSKLDWSQQDEEMLVWHRRLIELRRTIPSLSDCRRDRVETAFDEAAKWIAITRGDVSIVANLGEPLSQAVNAAQILLASDPEIELHGGALRLPRDSVAVVRR
jgi:maltooligosyltrehalose trehalohydrolase